MVSDYRQRTTVHNNTVVGTNGLHAANVHLANSPSISGSLHKQPIELIRKWETSTRKAENSPAERKLSSFRKFQAQNDGKDRYPYPIGYQALRNYAGHIYEMEIQEGAKGPVFVIVSDKGISCLGETPTIAWEKV